MTTYTPAITDRYYGPPQSVLQTAFNAYGGADCTSAEHPVLRCNVFYPLGDMPDSGWPVVLFSTFSGYTHGTKGSQVTPSQVIQHACLEKGMALIWADFPVARGTATGIATSAATFDPDSGDWGDPYRGNGVMFEATSNNDGVAVEWPGPIPTGYAGDHPTRPHPWLDPLWLNSSKAAMWLVQHCRYYGIGGDGDESLRLNINPNRIGAFGQSSAGTSFAWPAYQPNREGLTGDTSPQGQMDTRLNAAAFRQSTNYWQMFDVDVVKGTPFPKKPSESLNNNYDEPASLMVEVGSDTIKYLGADWFGGMGGVGFGGDLGDPGIYNTNKNFKAWWSSDAAMNATILATADRYIIDPPSLPAVETAAHSIYKAYRVKARLPLNTTMIVEDAAAVDPDPESGGGVAANKDIFTGVNYVYEDAALFLQDALSLEVTPVLTPYFDVKLSENFSIEAFPSAPQSKLTPSEWARNLIYERTTKVNNIPMFYREALRFMISKLGTLAYIDSETNLVDVKCVHANPERTIAKLKQENNIILPIISINQNSSSNADARRRYSPNIVAESFWSEEKKRAFRVISLAPRAVDIEYGINIWAKYKANLDQIVEQIRLLFNPHLVIKNSYTNVAQAFIEQESDNSTFETSDRQDRIIRRTFTIKLEGYVPNPKFLVTSTGELEQFNADTTIY
jgi:hypothetical protein